MIRGVSGLVEGLECELHLGLSLHDHSIAVGVHSSSQT
jgi:hypothetical protein